MRDGSSMFRFLVCVRDDYVSASVQRKGKKCILDFVLTLESEHQVCKGFLSLQKVDHQSRIEEVSLSNAQGIVYVRSS